MSNPIAKSRERAIEYARASRRDSARAATVLRHPLLSASVAATVLTAVPSLAFADFPFADFLVVDVLGGLFSGLYNLCLALIAGITSFGTLTATFGDLFGNGGNTQAVAGLYSVVKSIAEGPVKSCALSVLAVATLIQLLSIARKMDQGTPAMPVVREVFTLFCWLAITTYLINNGFDLVRQSFNLVNQITKAVQGSTSVSSMVLLDPKDPFGAADFGITADTNPGSVIVGIIVLAIAVLGAVAASVVANIMSLGRAIEVYLMAAFAPLPFAFLSMDATRQWGIGYIKQFLAVSLQAAVLVLLLYMFPLVATTVINPTVSAFFSSDSWDWIFDILKIPVVCVLLIITLVKSGSVARSILGG